MIETIDLTPTPEQYERLLLAIIHYNPRESEKAWARCELEKIQPALKARSWNVD